MAESILDLSWTDLFVGRREFYLKGVPGHEGEIVRAPGKYTDELRQILDELFEYTARDFQYVWGSEQFRTARMDTVGGQWFVLRRAQRHVPSLSDLGYPKVIRDLLRSPKKIPAGLVVFSGRTGSGKTTSASGYIRKRLEHAGGHAITIEDPPELPLHGAYRKGFCFQREMHHSEFGQGVVDAMRYGSPDIIMLGELREPHAVSEALWAAINGHLIVATIHTPGVEATVQRLFSLAHAREDQGAAPLLAEGISGIVHQTLHPLRNKHMREHPSRRESEVGAGPDLEVLFVPSSEDGKGIRSKIREVKFHQLSSDIQDQQNRLFLELQ